MWSADSRAPDLCLAERAGDLVRAAGQGHGRTARRAGDLRVAQADLAAVSVMSQNESGATVGAIMFPVYRRLITRCFISDSSAWAAGSKARATAAAAMYST